MDLLTVAARLFLDTGDYERAMLGAADSAAGFSRRLSAEMDSAAWGAERVLGNLAGSASGWGADMMVNFIMGVRSMLGSLRQAVSDAAALVRSYLGFSEPEAGPLSDFHTYAPDMMALFARGIRENAHLVTDQAALAFDLAPVAAAGAAAPAAIGIQAGEPRPVNVVFELDGVQRWVYRLTRAEEQRVGVKLGG